MACDRSLYAANRFATLRPAPGPQPRGSVKLYPLFWMTGKWRQRDVPHRGWTCEDIEDLGATTAVCEMCEVTPIRYVHYLTHPDFGVGGLGVGCVCAEKMEQDYVRPRERERTLRNAAARKRRWLTRNWRISSFRERFREHRRDEHRCVPEVERYLVDMYHGPLFTRAEVLPEDVQFQGRRKAKGV